MKARDQYWRNCGAVLLAIGCAPGILVGVSPPTSTPEAGDAGALLGLVVGLIGLTLVAGGSRTVRALRAEGGRHRPLLIALHDARANRRRALGRRRERR